MCNSIVTKWSSYQAAEAEIGNAVNTQRKESTVPSGTAPSHPVRNDDVKTSSPEIDLDRASSPENDVYNVEDPSLTITALGQNPPARGKDGKFNSSSANYRYMNTHVSRPQNGLETCKYTGVLSFEIDSKWMASAFGSLRNVCSLHLCILTCEFTRSYRGGGTRLWKHSLYTGAVTPFIMQGEKEELLTSYSRQSFTLCPHHSRLRSSRQN